MSAQKKEKKKRSPVLHLVQGDTECLFFYHLRCAAPVKKVREKKRVHVKHIDTIHLQVTLHVLISCVSVSHHLISNIWALIRMVIAVAVV